MKRRDFKEKETIIIICIVIIGAIVGAFLGGIFVGENINIFSKTIICIAISMQGALMALLISYFVTSAIMEVQTAVLEAKQNKKEI